MHTSYPSVKFTARNNSNIKNEVLLRYREIRKLISKEDLLWKKVDHREKIERFISSIFTKPIKLSGKKTFKQEISFRPTLNQVKEIINNFENNLIDRSISDIGFKLKNQTVLMLGGMHLCKEVTANIVYKDDGFASTQSLLDEINKRKFEFLEQIKELPIIEIDESYFLEESDNFDLFEVAR